VQIIGSTQSWLAIIEGLSLMNVQSTGDFIFICFNIKVNKIFFIYNLLINVLFLFKFIFKKVKGIMIIQYLSTCESDELLNLAFLNSASCHIQIDIELTIFLVYFYFYLFLYKR